MQARRAMLGAKLAAVVGLFAVSFARADGPDPGPIGPGDRARLLHYARDTWRSFEAMAPTGQLPVDGLRRRGDGVWVRAEKTSPTDIAAYLWSTLAAEELKLIEPAEARRRLETTLKAVGRLNRVHGFLIDRLDPRTGEPLKGPGEDGKPGRALVSSVDNGWLAVALVMIANTRPALHAPAVELLGPMDFSFFYEPYRASDPKKHPGQIYGVYQPHDGSFRFLHAMLNTEPRIVSYLGIARGQLPPEHYYRVDRAWRPSRGPQCQVPEGDVHTYRGVPVYEGHYTYRGLRIVPSWGGSMFEALMVPLFVPEAQWGPRSWGINHPLYVRAQIEHGLVQARYGYWGFSPACRPEGGYRTYGVKALGTSPDGYSTQDDDVPVGDGKPPGSPIGGVVTPHASFLALAFAPREALANLRALAEKFPIYTEYGFLDSVNVANAEVADRVLALDQGMIMAAIANALANNAMQHAFSDGAVEKAIRPLIAAEEFTAGPVPRPGSSTAGPPGSAPAR